MGSHLDNLVPVFGSWRQRRGGTMKTVVRIEYYRDAALLRKLLGHSARDHAAKTLNRCLSAGDDDGVERWREIGAAIASLDRKRAGHSCAT
jgi:hypothetical protein